MKRACDRCILRKVKCDGGHPCRTCTIAPRQHPCRYLLPAGKRGPKSSNGAKKRRKKQLSSESRQSSRPETHSQHVELSVGRTQPSNVIPETSLNLTTSVLAPVSPSVSLQTSTLASISVSSSSFCATCHCRSNDQCSSALVPLSVLQTIIEVYRIRMFPVWPVLHVNILTKQLQEPCFNQDLYALATSLCAATMAQLHISPVKDTWPPFSSHDMERECFRAREAHDYRRHPTANQVLVSFFLHVYHAKMDNRSAALLYLQEGLFLARLLKLDDAASIHEQNDEKCPADCRFLHLLLWVSERGYAIQHAMPISSQDTVSLPSIDFYEDNLYVQGLINLAELFVTFDSSSIPRFSRYGKVPVSKSQLLKVEDTLSDTSIPLERFHILQRVDFLVTKQWMRILLWQQAMSRGLLSSVSFYESMTFFFPAQVVRDLLAWMMLFSTDNLMPLGRDQLVKLFEIANTLADVILCSPKISSRGCRDLGPPDLLHGLYTMISPFLELDMSFNTMLREKTAEVLLRAAPRLITINSVDLTKTPDGVESEEDWSRVIQYQSDENVQVEVEN